MEAIEDLDLTKIYAGDGEGKTMAIQDWELAQYQGPAIEFVHRLGGDPNQMVEFPNGMHKPLWMNYAVRMYELRLMNELLRQFGMN